AGIELAPQTIGSLRNGGRAGGFFTARQVHQAGFSTELMRSPFVTRHRRCPVGPSPHAASTVWALRATLSFFRTTLRMMARLSMLVLHRFECIRCMLLVGFAAMAANAWKPVVVFARLLEMR